jgi:phosphoglycerate dehydrogenase-like enzyme
MFKKIANIIYQMDLLKLSKNAILINLSRGGLLEELALKKILSEKKIVGVALDVFSLESPIVTDFANLDNVLISPHIGGSSEEAILAMGLAAIDGLENAKNPLEFII